MSTLSKLDQAEAALLDAKESGDVDAIKKTKEKVRELREQYRTEEVAAGNRAPGLAVQTGDEG